jgi:hypothetical protein
MWNVLQPHIIATGFTLLTSVILWIFTARVGLIWGVSHTFYHRLRHDDGEIGVPTVTITVQNNGRARATFVEVVFNWPVDTCSVWPQRAYEVKRNPEGRMCIQFADLGPKEYLQIHLIDVNKDLPDVLTVRCAEAMGKQVPLAPMRVFPAWFLRTLWLLIFVGLFSAVYVLTYAAIYIGARW